MLQQCRCGDDNERSLSMNNKPASELGLYPSLTALTNITKNEGTEGDIETRLREQLDPFPGVDTSIQ